MMSGHRPFEALKQYLEVHEGPHSVRFGRMKPAKHQIVFTSQSEKIGFVGPSN